MRHSKRPFSIPKGVTQICVALFWLGLWQAAAWAVAQPLLLPAPLEVLGQLARQAGTLPFWRTVAMSVLRTGGAFAIGVALGALLAVLSAALPPVRALLRPALLTIRATPVSSFIILALVWLRGGLVPVLAGAVMVLPVIWGNVTQGIAAVDPLLLEMVQVYGFSRRKRLTKLYLPSVLPTFLAACETAMGLCWKATVAAEVLGMPKEAIGTRLHDAKVYLETDALFAWTLVVILLSLLLERSFARGVRAWSERRGAHAVGA